MDKKLKIATMVVSSKTYPATRNSKTQQKLFFDQDFQKDLTFWYRAGSKKELNGKKYFLQNNNLLIDTDDSSINMGLKTLLAFEWLLENKEFDFLVRPTPSSYINYSNLYSFIESNLLDKKFVYCGKIQSTNDKNKNKINFVSGSTLILNKKTVEIILNNKEQWDHSYWDDVALYVLLNSLNIDPQLGKRFDVTGNPLNQNIPLNHYQYRCRADNHYNYPRYLESYNLIIVHKLFNNHFFNVFSLNMLKTFYWLSNKLYVYQFGWKVYLFVRFISKSLLPNFIYLKIVNKLSRIIDNFKHKRFKT